MSEPFAVFGYGSLVNLDTLRTSYLACWPARLRGWRRTWLRRPQVTGTFAPVEGLAFLSVEREEGSEIDGLVIVHEGADLEALDAREALYRRESLPLGSIEALGPPGEGSEHMPLYLYVAEETPDPEEQPPRLLRSYLDAVFQGYRREFREAGLRRFIASTARFDLPVLEDRDEPIYPRAVILNDEERHLFDNLIPLPSPTETPLQSAAAAP